MTIDGTPAIRAFVEERLIQVRSIPDALDWRDHVIEELELIIALCDGLTKQSNALSAAYAEANIPI